MILRPHRPGLIVPARRGIILPGRHRPLLPALDRAPPLLAAWTKVQSANNTFSSPNALVTLNGVGAGNLLVLLGAYYRGTTNNTTTPVPSDSNGTMLAAVAPNALNPVFSSGDSTGMGIWYEKAAASGTHTINIPLVDANSSSSKFTLVEFSGGVGTLDQVSSAGPSLNTLQTRSTGATAALAQSTDLAVGVLMLGASVGVANAAISDPPTGSSGTYLSLFLQNNSSTDQACEFAYQFLASAAGQSITWSWTDTSGPLANGLAIATFLLTAPGGAAVLDGPTTCGSARAQTNALLVN
jgi:hypothetical protein